MKKQIYIYGAGNAALKLLKRLEREAIKVIGFIDKKKTGYLSHYSIIHPVQLAHADIIVISVQNIDTCVEIYQEIKSKTRHIYWFWDGMSGADFWSEECIEITNWGGLVLPRLDIHLSDKCNLNCVGCTHFSPLFDEVGCSKENVINDLKGVLTKFTCIARLNLLGGEPLLNTSLENIISAIRAMLPNTSIVLFTNGLLVPSLSSSLLHTFAEQKIKLYISEYTPTHMLKEKIERILERYHVQYSFSGYKPKMKFNKPLIKDLNIEHKKICMSNGCVSAANGRIARCPTLLYVFKLNEKFQCDYPQKGIYHLNDSSLTANQLLQELKKPVPLCDFCVKNEIDWHTCGSIKRLEDFVEDKICKN